VGDLVLEGVSHFFATLLVEMRSPDGLRQALVSRSETGVKAAKRRGTRGALTPRSNGGSPRLRGSRLRRCSRSRRHHIPTLGWPRTMARRPIASAPTHSIQQRLPRRLRSPDRKERRCRTFLDSVATRRFTHVRTTRNACRTTTIHVHRTSRGRCSARRCTRAFWDHETWQHPATSMIDRSRLGSIGARGLRCAADAGRVAIRSSWLSATTRVDGGCRAS
jgi:hypothetical protein